MEKMHRARYRERQRASLPCPGTLASLYLPEFMNLETLYTQFFWGFMGTSLFTRLIKLLVIGN